MRIANCCNRNSIKLGRVVARRSGRETPPARVRRSDLAVAGIRHLPIHDGGVGERQPRTESRARSLSEHDRR
jgi:hypothetical protein